jgi:hypothetical protein
MEQTPAAELFGPDDIETRGMRRMNARSVAEPPERDSMSMITNPESALPVRPSVSVIASSPRPPAYTPTRPDSAQAGEDEQDGDTTGEADPVEDTQDHAPVFGAISSPPPRVVSPIPASAAAAMAMAETQLAPIPAQIRAALNAAKPIAATEAAPVVKAASPPGVKAAPLPGVAPVTPKPPAPPASPAAPAAAMTEPDRSNPVGAKPRPDSPHGEGIPQRGTSSPSPPAPAPSPAPAPPAPLAAPVARPAQPPAPRSLQTPAGPQPACPQCEAPMSWVEEHLRFYCRSCKMYF